MLPHSCGFFFSSTSSNAFELKTQRRDETRRPKKKKKFKNDTRRRSCRQNELVCVCLMRLKIGKKLSISERRPLSFTSKTSLFPLHQKTHNILTGNLLWSSRVLIITTTDDGSFQYPAFYLPLPSDNEHILTYFVIYCECCLAPSSVK